MLRQNLKVALSFSQLGRHQLLRLPLRIEMCLQILRDGVHHLLCLVQVLSRTKTLRLHQNKSQVARQLTDCP